MAVETTALLRSSGARSDQVRRGALTAVLVACALVVVTALVGRELVSIQSLATHVQTTVLPRIMARQQRAIWTESLRSAASVVVYAPDHATRHQALAKAEQLAANVTHADIASHDALEDAWASIQLAAANADEAEHVNTEIRAMLDEADSLISDMSANLSSIVEDSGKTLDRLIRQALEVYDRPRQPKQTLEEVLAINTTSHDLLASLDRGRIILTSALTLENDRALESAETHFVAIASQLKARVDTLRGNSDYEYLPEMIERFGRLDAVFGHQRRLLALKQDAMAASESAKLRLGVVRETLAADAAAAVEDSVANIAVSARRIKLTAAAMVVILIIVVAIPTARSWQRNRSASGAEVPRPSEVAALPRPAPEVTIRATATSLETLIKAQGNLEHWRQTLIGKLNSAVNNALNRVDGQGGTGSDDGQGGGGGGSGGAGAQRDTLPPDLSPCLMRVVGCIEKVAAQTSLAGLKASLDGVRLIGGAVPDGEARTDAVAPGAHAPRSPSDALVAAAARADAVTEKIGNTISEINAVTMPSGRDRSQAAADIVRMIVQLGDQLSAICALDAPLAGPSGQK